MEFDLIKRYPFFSRFYVFLRLLILPPEKIERFIPKKGVILDVGCGYGIYGIFFAQRNRFRRIIGLELNKKRVSIATYASKGNNLKFIQKDIIKDTGLPECDSIFINDLLHHIPNRIQIKLLNKCFKLLPKNGVLIIKDMSDKPKWKWYYSMLHDKIMTLNDPLYFIKPKEVVSQLERIGFKVKTEKIKTNPLLPFSHIIYICKK